MIDAMLRLASTPRSGTVFALSRHGLISRAHTDSQVENDAPFWVEGNLSTMLAQMRAEVAATIARGEPWQSVFDRLETTDHRHLDALTGSGASALPSPSASLLGRPSPSHAAAYPRMDRGVANAGSLQVLAGRIVQAMHDRGGYAVTYTPRGQHAANSIRVSHIVNCTGPCADITKSDDLFIKQVLRDGRSAPARHLLGL